jgi:hypothetical protein
VVTLNNRLVVKTLGHAPEHITNAAIAQLFAYIGRTKD